MSQTNYTLDEINKAWIAFEKPEKRYIGESGVASFKGGKKIKEETTPMYVNIERTSFISFLIEYYNK